MTNPAHPDRRRGPIMIGVALLVVILISAWWWPFHQTSPSPDSARPLAMVISGDTAGWIVPCGCTSNQSGGLLRRGTYIRQLRETKDVVLADAGGAAAGITAYHRVKFEAILQGEMAMSIAAHNLGQSEIALGAAYLRGVAERLHVPFVSANVRDAQGQLITEPLRIVTAGRTRIALAGVASLSNGGDGIRVDEPREALLRATAAARGNYDALIVLAYLPEEELRQLAAGLPEADAIVGGPTGQSMLPKMAGPTLLASATNKGKFLVHLQLAATAERRTWSGSIAELNEKWADDPDQQENVRKYLAALAKLDAPASEAGFVAALPPGLPKDYRVAGSATCVSCHKNDCALWDGSKHAHAWNTLLGKGYHVDAFCQQCHTTGYGLPEGFESIRLSPARTSVGCESCHGPSATHVREPKIKTPFAAKDQCIRCHDHENSPQFAYDAYWAKILHGKSSGAR